MLVETRSAVFPLPSKALRRRSFFAYLALNHNRGTFGLDLFPHELAGRHGENNSRLDAELSASVGYGQTSISSRRADQVGLFTVLPDSILTDVAKTSMSSRIW